MSGRGGQGNWWGFKGNGNSQGGRSNRTAKQDVKKTINDYNYYIGSAKQASDYGTTTEFLINHIKKTFSYGTDIGQALETLQEIDTYSWKPTMKVTKKTETAEKEAEEKQFEIEFRADY